MARIRSQGFADYDIHPAGERELYTSIIFLEPFSGRNLAAFGYDMYAEPIRQQAMQRAAQLGETSITGKVTLVQRPMARSRPGCCSMCPCIARTCRQARRTSACRRCSASSTAPIGSTT